MTDKKKGVFKRQRRSKSSVRRSSRRSKGMSDGLVHKIEAKETLSQKSSNGMVKTIKRMNVQLDYLNIRVEVEPPREEHK
ncbi:hypothetical protein RND71_019220 [Anisodus tanguticus]|uniref:Uncharacterized protein n=1 Tax=Anisodus tanguticus TaxID=243964 RepID=A0AAE1RYK9_9SOLA|nr:hypothetical protein RND71_019220 [Anisodus tanguticus]